MALSLLMNLSISMLSQERLSMNERKRLDIESSTIFGKNKKSDSNTNNVKMKCLTSKVSAMIQN